MSNYLPIKERLLKRVRQNDGCWEWTKTIDPDGYGRYQPSKAVWSRYVHRIAYEEFKGPIPEGYQIDHVCKNRRCINPDHLEAVTPKENLLRSEAASTKNAAKLFCKNGHPFNEKNTYRKPGRPTERRCRICAVDYQKKRRQIIPPEGR